MRGQFSVMGGDVDGNDRNGDNGREYSSKHDDDEPCSAVCRLGRGLGDSHGIDKGVRDELNELHVFPMVMVAERRGVSAIAESQGVDVHLLSHVGWGLPESGQAHTLKDV
jgi:hypothetical protein